MTKTSEVTDLRNELARIEENMVTKSELGSYIESVAVLSDRDTMKQIEQSECDIQEGRVAEVVSVDDL